MSEPVWVPLGASAGPGQELAYAEFSAPVGISVSSEATATTIVSAPPTAFDGSPVLIDFFASLVRTPALAPPNTIIFSLWDGASSLGRIGNLNSPAAVAHDAPVRLERRLTPSAGSHTYSIRAHMLNGTGTVYGEAGGSGLQVPGFIRISLAAPTVLPVPGHLVPVAISTVLPSSPVDGQETILVDSLTAPTYSWRFRYVAAKATNKWVFIGGAPLVGEALGAVSTGSSTYVSLSGGPSVTVPVAGFYDIALGARAGASANLAQHSLISAKLGAAAAGDNESVYFLSESSTAPMTASKGGMRRSLAAGAVVEVVYRVGGSTTGTFDFRTLQVQPAAVGG